ISTTTTTTTTRTTTITKTTTTQTSIKISSNTSTEAEVLNVCKKEAMNKRKENHCPCQNSSTDSMCDNQSGELCSFNDINNRKPLMTFTFGDGSTQYSNKTPLDFDFNTSYKQVFQSNIRGGKFAFVNRVPDYYDTWYTGELDHTENDNDGYMLLANVEKNNTQLFSYSMNNLCVGLKYEFSAYLANVIRDELNSPKPNVRFEVWTTTENGTLLARLCTDSISQCTNMTWVKYGISFVAQNSSVLLLIISNAGGRHGNNLAIDDINIRVCSNNYSGFSSSG
ncbi:unnamed protein product, partial [Rotaria magnacalcarata]